METIDIFKELDQKLKDYISDKRLRDTEDRHIILKAMCDEEEAFSATDLYGRLLINSTYISQRAVYYNLPIFEDAKIIERVSTLENCVRYQICNCSK